MERTSLENERGRREICKKHLEVSQESVFFLFPLPTRSYHLLLRNPKYENQISRGICTEMEGCSKQGVMAKDGLKLRNPAFIKVYGIQGVLYR